MSMKLDIYNHFSDEFTQRFAKKAFKRNEIVVPAENLDDISIYYILKGRVCIFSNSDNGRVFLIDELGPGEFVGKFSQLRKCSFHSEGIAMTDCEMLDLTKFKDELLQDLGFSLYFHKKVSARIYHMYKTSMARDLFHYKELLAYCLVRMADDENNVAESDKHICWKLNISERQYFYLLKSLVDQGVVCKKNKKIRIIDKDYLEKEAANVLRFMDDSED